MDLRRRGAWRFIAVLAVALLAHACIAAAQPAAGQAPVPAAVHVGPGSVLWIEGGSTVHDWESRTTQPTLKLLRDVSAADAADVAALDAWLRAGNLRGLELGVPLSTMHSHKGSTLDKNMLKALKADKNPEITFSLTQARVGEPSGDSIRVSADGVLRVAGRERPITVAGRLVRSEAGVWLNGSHGLRMSEYDVKPPTMMMGTIRVRDSVSVHFNLLLAPGAPSTK
jgi:YceI-like protein